MQDVEIAVCALQRSGHHAILEWIHAMLVEEYGSAADVVWVNWVNEHAQQLDPFNTLFDGAEQHRKLGAESRHTPRRALMYNFEDSGVHMLQSALHYSDRYVGPSTSKIGVLILRDFYNMLASRLRRTRDGKPFSSDYLAAAGMWAEQAKLFSLRTRHHYDLGDFIAISYNDWWLSAEYRIKLAERLGLRYTENTRDTVHYAGFGSSFGQVEHAHELKVLDRWEEFKDDAEYIDIVDRCLEARVYGDSIFGWHLEPDSNGTLRLVPYQNTNGVRHGAGL